jgi:hypothetical protein
VPDHCFKKPPSQGGGYYPGAVEHADGLCVCVTGSTKSKTPAGKSVSRDDFATDDAHFNALAEHGRIHKRFDEAEQKLGARAANDPPNSATLGELEDEAAKVIAKVTGCDEKDLKDQMRKYHQGKGLNASDKFRADPYGGQTAPPYSRMGTNSRASTTARR